MSRLGLRRASPTLKLTGLNRRPLRADVPGAMCGNWGQFIPFARTTAEREANGDPRLSLAERYPSRAAYVDAIRRSVAVLQDQGLLLADDAVAYIADAERTAPIPD